MKKLNLNKKLSLNKKTISKLNDDQLDQVKGGADSNFTLLCTTVLVTRTCDSVSQCDTSKNCPVTWNCA